MARLPVQVRTEGVEELIAKLEDIVGKAFGDDVVEQAVGDGAGLVAARARQLVPVDRGVLQRSINPNRTKRDPKVWRVTAGGPGARHANLIELGAPNRGFAARPFLRPALDQERVRVVGLVRRHLSAAIDGVVR